MTDGLFPTPRHRGQTPLTRHGGGKMHRLPCPFSLGALSAVFPSGTRPGNCLATPSFLLAAGPAGRSDARQAAAGPAGLEATATPPSLCGNLPATGHRSDGVWDVHPLLEEPGAGGLLPACAWGVELLRTGIAQGGMPADQSPRQHQIGKENKSWHQRRLTFLFQSHS